MKRLLMAVAGLCLTGSAASGQTFPHERHAALFSSCEQCHAGVTAAGEELYPAAALCAGCHNGQIQPAVAWTPSAAPQVSTLRFTHAGHPPLGCENCHNQQGAPRMRVRRAAVERCLACHGGGDVHVQGPDASCSQCHVYRPGAARPASHGPRYASLHGQEAAVRTETCAACHVRQNCLDCHRPNAASYAGYHPPTFLADHAVAAYARQTSCSDCHNAAQFCASCHQQAGLVAPQERNLRRGYHDAKPAFIAGHGPVARQSLESCVSCHTERDCQACHSALGPQRISPHGPGFDGDDLAEKSRQMCTACHGASIPDSD